MRLPGVRRYPSEIIIHNDVWRIVTVRRCPKNWRKGQLAECDPNEHKITLLYGRGVSPDELLDSFFHEYIHACEESKSFRIKNHDHVCKLAAAMVNLFKQV